MNNKIDKQELCKCDHIYLLYMNNFKNECDACDDPSVPMGKKCPGFEPKLGYENVKS